MVFRLNEGSIRTWPEDDMPRTKAIKGQSHAPSADMSPTDTVHVMVTRSLLDHARRVEAAFIELLYVQEREHDGSTYTIRMRSTSPVAAGPWLPTQDDILCKYGLRYDFYKNELIDTK